MIHSISNTLVSKRIGNLHYYPYLAFLSILFVSIIQFYTLSIRFINYSQEAVQSILLWQNKNHKYDQHNIHALQPFSFWITNVVTYWIWFTYSIGTNTSISNSCEIQNYKGCLTIWSHSSLLPEWTDFIWAIINTVFIYNKMI